MREMVIAIFHQNSLLQQYKIIGLLQHQIPNRMVNRQFPQLVDRVENHHHEQNHEDVGADDRKILNGRRCQR